MWFHLINYAWRHHSKDNNTTVWMFYITSYTFYTDLPCGENQQEM
jgi:hypothetical protein